MINFAPPATIYFYLFNLIEAEEIYGVAVMILNLEVEALSIP
jgi:hypothetical protein